MRRLVLSEYMNPLGLAPERFVVAQDDASGDVVGCGQLKPWQRLSDRGDALGALVRGAGLVPNWEGDLVELASLVVAPGRRGKGLGSRIVGRLLEDAPQGGTVCLLTTGRGAAFYERHGFEELADDDVPRPLRAELAAGRVVAGVVARDRLCCMRLRR